MMRSRRFLVTAVALVAFVAFASASVSVVGTWKGKIYVDLSTVDKGSMELAHAESRERMTLRLNADRSFRLTVLPAKGRTRVLDGTWANSGTVLALTAKEENGRPAGHRTVEAWAKFVRLDRAGVGILHWTKGREHEGRGWEGIGTLTQPNGRSRANTTYRWAKAWWTCCKDSWNIDPGGCPSLYCTPEWLSGDTLVREGP